MLMSGVSRGVNCGKIKIQIEMPIWTPIIAANVLIVYVFTGLNKQLYTYCDKYAETTKARSSIY